jgi:hypothetical protein
MVIGRARSHSIDRSAARERNDSRLQQKTATTARGESIECDTFSRRRKASPLKDFEGTTKIPRPMPHPKEADVKRLLEASFTAVSEVFVGRAVPQTPFQGLDPDGDETFRVTSQVFDGTVFISDMDAALQAEPAVGELENIVSADSFLSRRFGTYGSGGSVVSKDQLSSTIRHHLFLLFRQYAQDTGTTLFDAPQFERFWSKHKAEIFRDEHSALRLVWLSNISVESGAFKLAPRLILRGISPFDQAPVAVPMDPQSIVEVLTTTKGNDAPTSRTEDEDDLDVALALLYRTFASGALINAFTVGYIGGAGFAGATPQAAPPAPFLRVTPERAAELGDFLGLVKAARNNSVVAIAMRRYVSARQRRSPADALIDYWIALESLFGTGTAELTFRMSLRIAAFIESDPAARRARFEAATESYKYRSLVVHGERGRPSPQLLESTDEMVRLSLYKICHSPTSYQPTTAEQDLLAGNEIATDGMTLIPPIPADASCLQ